MDPKRKRILKLMLDADIPSVEAAAQLLGISRSHLWRVLFEERAAAPTLEAFEALLAERLGRPVRISRSKAA